ncbi:MAG: tetratricopeptide repeat protein [Candidatus Lokiarchaeota archaeon]|nr:tetratricopeptide repeat protein [Candidatus Lokiarchaeota archaeon]
MKNCPYCNRKIKEYWQFCQFCNKPLLSDIDVESRQTNYYTDNFEYETLYDNDDNSDYKIDHTQDKNLNKKILTIDSKISELSKYGEPFGDLLLKKASIYYKNRKYSNTQKELEKALESFKIDNDKLKIAITHNELGLIKEELGFFEDSIYHFDESIQILKELNDSKKIIQVFNNIGNAYLQIKDIENSYQYYQHAIDLSKKENLIYEEIKSLSNLVEILFILKDYDRIKKILKTLQHFFDDSEDIYGLITNLLKYGKLYFFLGESYYEKSHEKLLDALELINKVDDQISVYKKSKLEWEIFLFMGKIYLFWDNLSKAENLLLKSLESVRMYEVENEDINESTILNTLAELFESKKEYEKSIEYYQLASDMYYKFGEDSKTAELKSKIGFIYLNYLDNSIKAIDSYESALKVFEKLEYFKELAEILNILGDIYLSKELIEIAISNFEKAKEYYDDLNDQDNSKLVEEKINSLIG